MDCVDLFTLITNLTLLFIMYMLDAVGSELLVTLSFVFALMFNYAYLQIKQSEYSQ